MKSTYIQTPKEEVSRKYPYLGKWEKEEKMQIVLFVSPGEGTLINSNEKVKTGYQGTQWLESLYTPLPKGEKVTLEND